MTQVSASIRWISSVVLLMAAAACTPPADSAFFNRGGPESLLDVSSEVVTLGVESPAKLKELSAWIAKDNPTRAELYCNLNALSCTNAKRLLESKAIAVSVVPSADNSVTLIYERILARDCSQRFVDNTHDVYNASHPAFGCSVAANMVQQVSNKREFVNPNLSDTPPAAGGVAAYNRAYAPKTEALKDYTVTDPIVKVGN